MKFSVVVVASILATAIATPTPAAPGADYSIARRGNEGIIGRDDLTSRAFFKKIWGGIKKVG
ncbi:hypothetical protein DL96DRAFT_1825415 [Flagelloscypha sp. PMI_526]|nr:hypothetical protein DL96DRAFT_1825415 [Flagelloscypha sp. PMI_526]